jgi:hypothetical protein
VLSLTNYSASAKLLHHLALSTNFLGETTLDIELSTQGKNLADNHAQRHVFVTGLARAGTTLLMRMLYESGEFSSLTYRDMPFVLAPNLWARVSGNSKKQMNALERAHGDGILVDYDSPEAFEEVFWRVTSSKEYITADVLRPMHGNEDVIHLFRRYIDLILHRYQGSRYLSKNNNNILRLPVIAQAFPNAIILVPFRDPVQHAQSLLKQHRRFCAEQSKDKFVKRYMTWLGHHEFGQDHRPFQFDRKFNPDRTLIDEIDYWLQNWVDAYQFVLNQARSGGVDCIFFSYERLCVNPEDILEKLQNLVNIPETESSGLIVKESLDVEAETGNIELLSDARRIYTELSKLSNSHFAG